MTSSTKNIHIGQKLLHWYENHHIDYIENYKESVNISSLHLSEQMWNESFIDVATQIDESLKSDKDQIQSEIDRVNVP